MSNHQRWRYHYQRQSAFLEWPQDISLHDYAQYALDIMVIVSEYEPLQQDHTKVEINHKGLKKGALQKIVEEEEKYKRLYGFEGKIHFATESLSFALDTKYQPARPIIRLGLTSSGLLLTGGVIGAWFGETDTETYTSIAGLATSFLIGGYTIREFQRERAKTLDLIIGKKHGNNIGKQERLFERLKSFQLK